MGFLGKLFGFGVAAGATVAAVQVAKKYEENRNAEAADLAALDTDDVQGVLAQDSAAAVLDDVKKAAAEVYTETAEKVMTSVKNAAEKAGIDTDEVGEALSDAGRALAGAGKAVVGAGSAVVHKMQEEAPEMLEKAKDTAEHFAAQAKDTVEDVTEAVRSGASRVVNAVEAVTTDATGDAPQGADATEDTQSK